MDELSACTGKAEYVMPVLSAMRWLGGKSWSSPTGTGRWVASLLPSNYTGAYVEPFAGMLGVLLQRAPMRFEIVNDLDGDVVNWWLCVRDHADEFARALALTPKALELHSRARGGVPSGGAEADVRRAVEFTMLVQCAVAVDGPFVLDKGAPNPLSEDWRRGLDDSIVALAQRLRNVQVEHRDACDLLADMAGYEDAVIYVDPPYAGTSGYSGLYRHIDDRGALVDVLRAQRGSVAVSGYGGEWDGLGWERHEHRTYTTAHASAAVNERVEVLWTNYVPEAAAQGGLDL